MASSEQQDELKADFLAVKQALGKLNVNILFVRRIKLEGKSDKNETRIMAITTHRVYVIVTQKQHAKVDFSFHILELKGLEYSKSMAANFFDIYIFQLNLMVCIGDRQFQYGFLFSKDEDVQKSLSYMVALLRSNFIDADIGKHIALKIDNDEKREVINNQTNHIVQSLCGEDHQACGSFAAAYKSLCDLYNQVPLEEVIWDINKIYASHNCKAFKIEDFDHLEQKELLPLLASLAYNHWFTSLIIASYKMSAELVEVLIKIIQRSPSIEEFVVTDAHVINKDQIQKISLAISANPYKCLKRVNFSKNSIEDKGVSSLSTSISNQSIEQLSLSDISMTAKGASYLSNSLKSNKHIGSSLTTLDLSNNTFKIDGAQSICDFLAQPNVLENLDISNTDCALDLMFGALLRGCQQNLQHLNLSGNPFSYKKSKEIQSLPSFQQFFSSSAAIKTLDISNTKIPAQALKAILVGLMNNPVLTDVGLDLSRNDLKSAGANEICSCVKEIKCLTKLDLSENGLDQELASLCEAFQSSPSIKHLNLARNITKSKHNNAVGEALAEMVMSEILPLEKLSIADCKLRLDAAALFDCLGTNESITSIDISGNNIGDVGARLLAKALQINIKLKEIQLDRNNISHKGLQDISLAMQRNFSLLSIPIPIGDLTMSLKHNADAFVKYYSEIEKSLIRNQSTKESTPEQLYKIHQNLFLSTVDHYTNFTDSFVVQLQDLVLEYHSNEDENVVKELKTAKDLIKETDLFRQVLLELFSDPITLMRASVDTFNKGVTDISNAAKDILKTNVNKMVDTAKRICPCAFDNKPLLPAEEESVFMDRSAIYNTLMQLGKSDITYQLCEASLSVANILAENLKKLLVQALKDSIHNLKKLGDASKTTSTSSSTNKQSAEIEDRKADEIKESPSVDISKDQETNETKNKEPAKEEDVFTDSTEELKVSTPALKLLNEIGKDENFDMPWEFDMPTDKKSSVKSSSAGDVEEEEKDKSFVAANKARTRLNTTANIERHKRKNASLKRRPTFMRHSESGGEGMKEVEISIDDSSYDVVETPPPKPERQLSQPEPIPRSTSASKKPKDEVDGSAERIHLASIGGFDDLSSNASQLKISKDRVKPMAGRRAPSRVSNLAHMNTEATDAYIEELAKAPARPMSPRPVSAMPALNSSIISELAAEKQPATRRSSDSSKLRPETPPKKPEKKESKKEKKGKSPIGGIKLPTLPGLLKRKDRSSSKGDIQQNLKPSAAIASDHTDGPAATSPIETKKVETPVEDTNEPLKTLDEEDTTKEKPNEAEESEVHHPPARPDPTPTKRPAPKVPAGMPLGGGSALLAEMKKRQAKEKPEENKESKDSKPPPTASRPQRPKPPEKPEHRNSISGPKPPAPKRPPSFKKQPSEDTGADHSPTPPVRPGRPTPMKRLKEDGNSEEVSDKPEVSRDVNSGDKSDENEGDKTDEETNEDKGDKDNEKDTEKLKDETSQSKETSESKEKEEENKTESEATETAM